MNKITTHRLCFSLGIASAVALPAPCWATSGPMPWDQTLLALQDFLISSVAPAAIVGGFVSAGILYTLGGHDQQARRLVGSGIGGCIALALVYLLNYLLP